MSGEIEFLVEEALKNEAIAPGVFSNPAYVMPGTGPVMEEAV